MLKLNSVAPKKNFRRITSSLKRNLLLFPSRAAPRETQIEIVCLSGSGYFNILYTYLINVDCQVGYFCHFGLKSAATFCIISNNSTLRRLSSWGLAGPGGWCISFVLTLAQFYFVWAAAWHEEGQSILWASFTQRILCHFISEDVASFTQR